MALADYIKEHPQLYDKKHRHWLNVVAKNALWVEIGQTLEPPATGERMWNRCPFLIKNKT